MSNKDQASVDDQFADKARRLFATSTDSLDGETRSRLNRSRQLALKELSPRPRLWTAWVPAGGIAAAAVAVVVVWSGGARIDQAPVVEIASDFEILLNEDSLEMIQELEFYSWIELESEGELGQETANNVG